MAESCDIGPVRLPSEFPGYQCQTPSNITLSTIFFNSQRSKREEAAGVLLRAPDGGRRDDHQGRIPLPLRLQVRGRRQPRRPLTVSLPRIQVSQFIIKILVSI